MDLERVARLTEIALTLNNPTALATTEEYLAHFAPDVLWRVGQLEFKGHAGVARAREGSRKIYPGGLEREILAVVADEERVAIQYVGRGVTNTGRSYENQYAKFFWFDEDGQVSAIWEYLDTAHAATHFDGSVLAPSGSS